MGTSVTLSNVKGYLASDTAKARFSEILGDKAPMFMASIVNAVSTTPSLQKADFNSIIAAAFVAASLDLPIEKNLGFSYIIPYGTEASFQLGYKGITQLALRTGQYKNINVIDVREGELVKYDRLTEEIKFNFIENGKIRSETPIIGYAGFFELVTGFKKTVYWTVDEVEAHARRYSANYKKYATGQWKDNFDAMAKKTVLKNMLSHWGILSVQLQKAMEADQAVYDSNGEPNYVDNPEYVDKTIDNPFEEAVDGQIVMDGGDAEYGEEN